MKLPPGYTRRLSVASLSDAAFRLHLTALDFCSEQRSNGRLTKTGVTLLPRLPRSWRALAIELVGAGLWVQSNDDAWELLDAERHDPELLAKRTEAGRKGGLARRSNAPPKEPSTVPSKVLSTESSKVAEHGGDLPLSPTPPLPNSTGLDLSDSESSSALSSSSEPVRLPAREPQSEVKPSRKAKRTPAPEASEFVPNEATTKCAREVGADLKRELVACFDHHRGKGSLMADWQAVVRTWLRSPFRTTQSSGGRRDVNPPGFIPFEQRPESRRFDQPAPRRGGPPTLAFGGNKT